MRFWLSICFIGFLVLSCKNEPNTEQEVQEEIIEIDSVGEESVDSSFESLLSYYEPVELPYSFDSGELFAGLSYWDTTTVPHGEYVSSELGYIWYDEEADLNYTYEFLEENIPGDFYTEYPPDHTDPVAGFSYKIDGHTYLVSYSFDMISATNGAIWIIWLFEYDENNVLLSVQDIGIDGSYDTGGYSEDEENWHYVIEIWESTTYLEFTEHGIQSNIRNMYSLKEEHGSLTEDGEDEVFEREKSYPAKKLNITYQ